MRGRTSVPRRSGLAGLLRIPLKPPLCGDAPLADLSIRACLCEKQVERATRDTTGLTLTSFVPAPDSIGYAKCVQNVSLASISSTCHVATKRHIFKRKGGQIQRQIAGLQQRSAGRSLTR